MKKPEFPANEVDRVAALCGLGVLDTPAEERFDRITRIAQQHFRVPITLVSLIDSERQWFKSRQGLSAPETPREISFCGHAILSEDILYIPNALADPRFADNPLVTGSPNIRFYAGAPLHAPGGERVGTLCIIDDQPRSLSADELNVLRDLADCIEAELERTHIIEAALEAQRFKQILDKARDMIFMFDADTLQFVYLNQGALQSMGYTREAMLQLHPYDIKPQFPEPAFRQLLAPLLSGAQEVLRFETVHRRKDGSDFPVEIFLQLAREEGVHRFVAIVRDITERKRVEAELTANENRIRAIVDTVVDGIISIDSSGRIQTANPAAENIFGYRCDEMLGRNVNFLMPEPFHSAHDGYLHNYLVTGEKKVIGIGREVTGRRADGSTFPMELAVSEMAVNGERMFTGIVRDISARRQAEAELEAITAMRQAILESANFSIIATDTEGLISVFNKGAQRMLGYTEEEIVCKQTPAIIHVPAEVVARAKALSAELGKPIEPGFEVFIHKTRQGHPDENEWTYVRKDGSTIPVLLSVTALFDDGGKIFGYLGIGYDLTERLRVDKMKREFISTVSHELRTPLTSIRGALGLVAGGATGVIPDKARELVSIASKNCDRLVRLINDMLDMEKIESGKMSFDLQPVDLRTLVEEAIDANQAYAAQHQVKIAIEGELRPTLVNGDRDRLMQVLTNLLSNAAKFTPPGGTVHLSLADKPDNVVLRVRDEGPGIPEDFKSCIFQKFSQADSSDTRGKGGTGLGLSITKAIVEHHGGQIGFESVAGQGTTFWVHLPARPVAEMGKSQAGQTRVLHVENDADIAHILSTLLEGVAEVDVAATLKQAHVCLDQNEYALVILDIGLPDGSGLDLLPRLGQLQPPIPILVFSAQEVNAQDHRQVSAAFVKSRVDVDSLARAIRAHIATRDLAV